jgi:CubicO group peptidase (beta-lactamase class C family)
MAMAYREFDTDGLTRAGLSRRGLLRGGAMFGIGALAAGNPLFARAALAQEGSAMWQAVTALVNGQVKAGKVANVVAAMGWNQSAPEIISAGTLAIGGSTPAGADSLYRIYSMTKPITGMAAMMLIDDGRLGLDQPVAEILPAFATMQVQKEYDGAITPDNLEPAARPITIRQLMTHTSGLSYGIIQQGPIAQALGEKGLVPGQVSRLPVPGVGRAKAVEGLDTFADGVATMPLVYQPGTKWSYSAGLDVLGRVIEVASGMPFDQFLHENVFEPCGMTSTFFRVPESEKARLTTNYLVTEAGTLPIDPASASIYLDQPPFPMGGAGLVSSPADYDRWLRMLLGYGKIDGRRVMGELAVRVGTSDLLADSDVTAGTMVDGEGFGAGGRVSRQGGSRSFGWGGAAGTAAFVDFASGLRAGMFTQYMPSDALPLQSSFTEAVLTDLAKLRGS